MHSRGCAAFTAQLQLIVTDGLDPTQVGAKFEEDPQAGTETPAPAACVHERDSVLAIDSEVLKSENAKTPEITIPKNKIRNDTAIFLSTNLIIAVWGRLEKGQQKRAS